MDSASYRWRFKRVGRQENSWQEHDPWDDLGVFDDPEEDPSGRYRVRPGIGSIAVAGIIIFKINV